ncbi:MAG: hypothetical protein ACI9F9_001334 [Candidatus Paceibacteria bacterium]|jgi:hypothetical protein
MSAFFTNMSLARLIILISIPGSIFLAWAGLQHEEKLGILRNAYTSQIPKVVREIQELSKFNTKLQKDIKGDLYLDKSSPVNYVRSCADNPAVEMGEVNVTLSERPGVGGVIDNKITIRPLNPKDVYTHSQIAAFLYRLEADSSQIKVTDIKYNLVGRGIKTDDIPEDKWTFEATITNRVKDPSKAKPNSAGR